jgi:hypothetical protein
VNLTHRIAAIAVFLFAAGAAAFASDGTRAAAAEGAKPAGTYLVIDVSPQIVDNLLALKRGTSPSSGFPEPKLELSYKYCGTYQCLCIDVEPEECVPESDRGGLDRISLDSSLRMPAVLDRIAQELKSGKYSAVRLCSTFQSLYVGCVEASLPQK